MKERTWSSMFEDLDLLKPINALIHLPEAPIVSKTCNDHQDENNLQDCI